MPIRRPALLACLALLSVPSLAADGGTPLKASDEVSTKFPPDVVRPYLRRRMARHGEDMMVLLASVTLLERDVVKASAKRLAEEPRLARPIMGGSDDPNAAIPERFFLLQDTLRAQARALAKAADQKDDALLATRFGELTATCVACHSSFLPPPEKAAIDREP